MRLAAWFRSALLGAALVLGAAAGSVACSLPGNLDGLTAAAGTAMNAARGTDGLATLTRDARLDRVAQDHACWMSESGEFSHTGASGSSFGQRLQASGYPLRRGAENIALGQTGGADVVAAWMASSGHRRNILLGGAQAYGVGLALLAGRPVWVMVFAGG